MKRWIEARGSVFHLVKQSHFEKQIDKLVYALAFHGVGEHKRFTGTHQFAVMAHHFK